MTNPYRPAPSKQGWSTLTWIAVGVGGFFALMILIAIAIPVFINVTGGPSVGDDPAPNIGAQALRVGEVRGGRNVDTSVLEVRRLKPQRSYPAPAGSEWLGVDVKACAHADASTSSSALTWQNWTAVDSNGVGHAAGGRFEDYPAHQFPEVAQLAPGQCHEGWIALPVPVGASKGIAKIVLTVDGAQVAEWVT